MNFIGSCNKVGDCVIIAFVTESGNFAQDKYQIDNTKYTSCNDAAYKWFVFFI